MPKFSFCLKTVDGNKHYGTTEGPDLKTVKKDLSKDTYYDTGSGIVFRDKVINIDLKEVAKNE